MKLYRYMMIGLVVLGSCGVAQQPAKDHLDLLQSASRVGVGLVHLNLNNPIPLYRSYTDSVNYDVLTFEENRSLVDKGSLVFKTNRLGEDLRPYLMDGGDTEAEGEEHRQMGLIHFAPQLVFRVMEKRAEGVVVMVNEKTKQTSFIRIDEKNDYRKNADGDTDFFDPNFVNAKISNWFYYETWGQVLKRAWLVSFPEQRPLYYVPGGEQVKYPITFDRVDSVSGDWARLRQRNPDNGDEQKYAWIKWKSNDSLLLDIVLNGGYE